MPLPHLTCAICDGHLQLSKMDISISLNGEDALADKFYCSACDCGYLFALSNNGSFDLFNPTYKNLKEKIKNLWDQLNEPIDDPIVVVWVKESYQNCVYYDLARDALFETESVGIITMHDQDMPFFILPLPF